MHFLRFYVMKQKAKDSQRDEHNRRGTRKEKLCHSPNSIKEKTKRLKSVSNIRKNKCG